MLIINANILYQHLIVTYFELRKVAGSHVKVARFQNYRSELDKIWYSGRLR